LGENISNETLGGKKPWMITLVLALVVAIPPPMIMFVITVKSACAKLVWSACKGEMT
jgi:hypothetical protein